MTREAQRLAEFLRAFDAASAMHVVPWAFGTGFFRDDMPRVHDLNFVRLDAGGEPGARRLADAADEAYADRGLRHRKVMAYDERGERLRREFAALGWDTERDVVMVLRAGRPAPDRPRGEEVGVEDVMRMREIALRSESYVTDDDLLRQLVDKDRVFHDARSARHFAVRSDAGEVVAACDLYTDGRIGQIEDVGTLVEHRGHGHATAVVLAAIDASLAAGHEITFLIADDEDWPKEMYARLGFEPVSYVYEFWRSTV